MCVIHDPKGPLLYSFNFSSVGGFTEMPYKMADNTLNMAISRIYIKAILLS